MGRFFLAAMGAVFFLIGGGIMLFVGKPTLDAAKASKSWPSVDGVVIESRVETKRSNDRHDGPSYKAVVVYDYEVNNEAHSSDRIWFGSEVSTSKRGQMRDIVKQYPEGAQTTVYYDPDTPSEAVLQPGAFFTSYFMIIFGSVFAVVGGIMLLVAVFAMKPKAATSESSFLTDEDSSGSFDDDDDPYRSTSDDDGHAHWSDSGDDD